ncbi:nitronate monooxygenase [Micrococcus luteus]|uniref:nitronate monooxygenase n=1 Tax=Micrococcus luteus TaxID=1270 RepID=UPI0033E7A460
MGTAEDVRALLTAGADAVSAGTAFLLTPEAGTSAAHRAAVAACAAGTRFSADDGRARTGLTRAYTGRWARSLATAFMAEHPDAPAAYPEVNVLTKGLRAAAAAAGDLERVHLWAGTEAHRVREAPAADVLASLAP